MLPKKCLLLVTLLILIVPLTSLVAQSQPIISIALPTQMRTILDIQGDIFSDFEQANNVSVYVNYVDADIPPMSGGMDAYLDAIAKYVATADVLDFNTSGVTSAVTQAGYLLDLSPLTSADSSLNSDDFVPAAWNSMQWDGGVWGLPVSLDATMLIYDPAAFDKAGIAYPNAHWTIDDLANAAKALTQMDSSGNVTVPGLAAFGDTAALFRSLYGKNFADDTGNPSFADPALEDILTKWQDMVSSGYVGSSLSSGEDQPPMRLMSSFGLGFPLDPNQPQPQAVDLPGGKIGLTVDALAISSGTTQPELAYKLAKYLTTNASFANSTFGGIPARQSLASAAPTGNLTVVGGGGDSSTSSSGGGDGGSANGGVTFSIGGSGSPQAQAALAQLLPDALTISEQGYSDYVSNALQAIAQGTDAHTALQDQETQAVADLQTATDRRSSVSVIVATPPPPIVLAPGKIALNFGLESNIQPIPNMDQWQQLASDFSSSDPDVGEVKFDTRMGASTDYAQRDDCFYLNSNAVPDLDETTILNLDPYLEADTSFDANDVVTGVMSQLQKDNHTWAYPLTIQPQTLRYNSDIFQKAGVPDPTSGWTISQFTDALNTLKTYLNTAPFVPHDLNGESLMMLIAAYGGLPIDYRTSPATINFTDPATISAIQQVLDLAKNGTMAYQELAGSKFRMISISSAGQDAITTDALLGFEQIKPGSVDPYQLAGFPTGTYNGVSYTIGTGYISATSQNPDGCYRWLSYIAQHINVFGQMPARLSQISANQSANSGFYTSYAQLLQDAKTIVFPAAGELNSIGDFIIQFWLNRAFDHYVQNDADLTTELTDAQTYATAFEQCVQALPPADQSDDSRSINNNITDCAKQADPSVADLFSAAPATISGGG